MKFIKGKQTVVTHRTLDKKSGSEGPRHDPYSYSEYIVHLNEETYILHLGLENYFKIDKVTMAYDQQAVDCFYRKTGFTLHSFDESYYRKRSQCSCGSRDIEAQSGFPGETMYVCVKCKKIVDCDFNEGAVI